MFVRGLPEDSAFQRFLQDKKNRSMAEWDQDKMNEESKKMERRNIMAVQIGQSAGLTLDFDDVKKHGKALEDLQKNLTKIAESFGTITQKNRRG